MLLCVYVQSGGQRKPVRKQSVILQQLAKCSAGDVLFNCQVIMTHCQSRALNLR